MRILKELDEIIDRRMTDLRWRKNRLEAAEDAFVDAAQKKANAQNYLNLAKQALEEGLREKYELEHQLEGSMAESIEKIFGRSGLELIRRQILRATLRNKREEESL